MQQQSSQRFFMTRQSANILRDLSQRCQQAGNVSVLHGVSGVGKSRLLAQFVHKYALGNRCFLIRFNRSGEFFAVPKPASKQPQDRFKALLLARIPAGAILLLDAFEYADEPLRHELFEFWLAQAKDKDLKLVIAISSEHLPALQQSITSFLLPLESVALEPLTPSEQLAFVQASCCTGAAQQLIISAQQKKQLLASAGVFSAVLNFIEQQGATLDCRPAAPASMAGVGWNKYALVLLLAIAVFMGYRYTAESMPKAPAAKNVQPVHAVPQSQVLAQSVPVLNQAQKKDDSSASARQETLAQIEQKRLPPQMVDSAVAPESGSTAKTDSVARAENMTSTLPPSDLFGQRLASTREWLSSAASQASGIQLMTLQATPLTRQTLNRYLQQLDKSRIDLDQIQIFPFWRNGKKMYGVLYGRYASAAEARAQIAHLPKALRADHPMIRTVQGINRGWHKADN